ncbi:MAG: HAMP domain-containing histidine kinase [Oscillospiraceae bacterium]|jgi:signal transduction histidine kinase|nr:HAMP domain-containing histidine kinase [Oscillospiraceae bacterium]
MMTSNRKLEELSNDVRRIIDGQDIDIRDNREGILSILKNDIYTLAAMKNEQVDILNQDKIVIKNTIADISHQLKIPLTSMLIMIDLLESAPPEKQREFIDSIRQSLTHTDWLVSSLLKMAKLDAGAVDFSREEIGAERLIKIALEPLQILLELKNLSVTVEGGAAFFCDRRWTAEALSNVIKNSAEHSPEGGEIKIASGSNPVNSWVSVTDSGPGIASKDIPGLFRRYKGSRSGKGYGVGLPLALAIMEGQGGGIDVDGGGNGAGATFTLKLYR